MTCLVDLLVAAGNIVATSAAAQTVNTTALTRYTTGAGVMATLEVTTQTSATAHNVTINKYTDQDGNTLNTTGAQTAQAAATANIVQRLVPVDTGSPFFSLASGDYGIRERGAGNHRQRRPRCWRLCAQPSLSLGLPAGGRGDDLHRARQHHSD
jgi:hypothetical protein